MKLIYTAQTSGFDDAGHYRNPRYFDGVETGASEVVVIGDWPEVVQAYKDAEVEVSVSNPPEKSKSGGATKADLQAQLAELGVAFPSNANKADLQALLDSAQQSNPEGEGENSGENEE